MAYSVTAPVTNNIELAKQFLPILDEIYEKDSLTRVLDTANDRVKYIGANTVNLFEISMAGLGDYSRNNGFVSGDTDGAWKPYTLEIDRGRSYMVDTLDNDESVGMAFSSLLSQTERTQVIPEIDAYRFAKYCSRAGFVAPATTITDDTDVADMIATAQAELDDANVPMEGRILFVSNKAYKKLKKDISRFTLNKDNDVNYNIEMYDEMQVIKVPKNRFNTLVSLATPSSASDVGGYSLLGADINFMIIHPTAILQIVKHLVPRIFSPEVNQEADAWKFDYRIYHDCFVTDNKTKGVYLSASKPAVEMSASASTVSISGTATSDVTISNYQGVLKAVSSDTAKATVTVGTGESANKITVKGVSAGTSTVTVTDGIGQSVEIAVTVSSASV